MGMYVGTPRNYVVFLLAGGRHDLISWFMTLFSFWQVGDMAERGISEAFKVKQAVLLSATEAAEMILRVDEIITCAPRQRENRM